MIDSLIALYIYYIAYITISNINNFDFIALYDPYQLDSYVKQYPLNYY